MTIPPAKTFCPATMCPLFARDGSPWTGDKNSTCPRAKPLPGLPGGGCGWWKGFGGSGCDGASAAREQVAQVAEHGRTLQIGPVHQRRAKASPRTFDCDRAGECQWQVEAGDGLCPPRLALSKGIDPKACAY